jgi:aspartyl-tRNA(Asn)/glutamyl-tRNA(Gln) amidotransferase subunit C
MSNLKSQISNLTKEEVKHIAKLAKLKLTEEEVEKFQKQLSEVLEYMKVLNEVETGRVEPTAQVTGLENVFREDEVSPSLEPNEALSCAPAREGNFFKTGVVLEK